MRPTNDMVFMQAARLFALRSTCERGHVGAVIVQDRRIISHGYNGSPPGMKHCTEVGCEVPECVCTITGPPHVDWCPAQLGCQRTIHAEANALAWAARRGIPTEDATMYSTHSPCRACASLIIAAGIGRFIYLKDYRLGRLDLLDAVNIPTHKMSVPETWLMEKL